MSVFCSTSIKEKHAVQQIILKIILASYRPCSVVLAKKLPCFYFYFFESTWLEDVFKIRYLFNDSIIFVFGLCSDVKDMKKNCLVSKV